MESMFLWRSFPLNNMENGFFSAWKESVKTQLFVLMDQKSKHTATMLQNTTQENWFKSVKRAGKRVYGVCVFCCSHDLDSHWHTLRIPSKDKFLSIWNFFLGHWTVTPTLLLTHTLTLKKLSADPNWRPFALWSLKAAGFHQFGKTLR